MKFDLERMKRSYTLTGYVVLDGLLSDGSALLLANRALNMCNEGHAVVQDHVTRPSIDLYDGGGLHRYEVAGGAKLRSWFPDFIYMYESLCPLVSAVTGLDIVTSPYMESAINLMVYRGGGAQCPAHFDSNTVTLLLYLTTNPDEGATTLVRLDTKYEEKIQPQTGRAVILKGREIWHASEPVDRSTKIAVTFNYYTPDDTWRPEAMDQHSYGQH